MSDQAGPGGSRADEGEVGHVDRPDRGLPDADTVLARERRQFGGMKLGCGFFGWLTATGAVVLLTALVGGAGLALGLGAAADVTRAEPRVGVAGGIAFLVILFAGYVSGGYVAGRMARFSGLKQGLAVWLWAVVIAVVLAVVGGVLGGRLNVMDQFEDVALPRLDELTTSGLIGLALLAVVSLLGALLGGALGMRYHRRVDRVGLESRPAASSPNGPRTWPAGDKETPS